MDRSTGAITWGAVVTQIKNYAKANDNIPTVGVGRLPGPLQARVPARLGERQQLHLRHHQLVPGAVGEHRSATTSTTSGSGCHPSTVKSFFSKAIGNGDLTVGATSTAKVVFTVASAQSTALVGRWPVRALHPQPDRIDARRPERRRHHHRRQRRRELDLGHGCIPEPERAREDHDRRRIDRWSRELRTRGVQQLLGRRVLPAWSQQGAVTDPLAQRAAVRQRIPSRRPACICNLLPDDEPPAMARTAARSAPGIYSEIKNSHTLNPGIYVLKGDITLNGNDLIQGDGVMLYFACSNYPSPVCRQARPAPGSSRPGTARCASAGSDSPTARPPRASASTSG